MSLAELFSRLRPRRMPPPAGPDHDRVAAAAAHIAELSPGMRMARRYAERLEPAVSVALGYVDGIVAQVQPAREASAAAWATDPYIHAFFTGPDAVAPALSRSPDLRAFFAQYPAQQEAYAVLGMAMTEKRILGAALEGEVMRRDVVQNTVSFSDHQVRICGRDEPELRQEIVRRLVDQLGLQGLARFAAEEHRRGLLEQERALLKTRLQLMERQGIGMRAVVGAGTAASPDELAQLHEEIKANETELQRLGMRTESLDRELAQVCAVLADPGAHLYVETKRFILNKMNVELPEGSSAQGEEIVFHLARVPTTPPLTRAFTLVRFARDDLLAAGSLLDEAARLLH